MHGWNYIKDNNYPNNNEEILVWNKSLGYVPCTYYGGDFYDKHDNNIENVIAWFILPEPPID